ncbi:hypothetical protein niasHS_011952 [Heterodera schachtii]|uniref:Uncharacterized protein n=1 Tax=Heterodera schachtii TaxID=97005 RepID=A0ABD2ID27_HETSC
MRTGSDLANATGLNRANWHEDWVGFGINSRAGLNMAKLAWGLGRYWHKQQGGTEYGQIGMGLGRSWHKRNGTEHGQIGMGTGTWPNWHGDWARVGKRNGTEHGQIDMGTGPELANATGPDMAKLAWGLGRIWHKQQGGTEHGQIGMRTGGLNRAKLAPGLGRIWPKQQGGTGHGKIGMGLGRSWHKRNGTEQGQIGMGTGRAGLNMAKFAWGLGRIWPKQQGGTEHGQIGMGTGSELVNARGLNRANWHGDWVGFGPNSRAGLNMAKLAWGLGRSWHKQQGGTEHGQIGMGTGSDLANATGLNRANWHEDWVGFGKRNRTEQGKLA